MYLPFNTLNGPGCDSHLGASAFGHKCTENDFWLRDTAYSEGDVGGQRYRLFDFMTASTQFDVLSEKYSVL